MPMTNCEFYNRLLDERDRMLHAMHGLDDPTGENYTRGLGNLSTLLHLLNAPYYLEISNPANDSRVSLEGTFAPGGCDIPKEVLVSAPAAETDTTNTEAPESAATETTPPEAPRYSKTQIRQILGKAQTDHPTLDLPAVLHSMGAKMLSDVPGEKYPELLDRLNAAIKELG